MLADDLRDALPDILPMFKKKGVDKLAPVYSALGGNYTYDELKLARILLV
jgi:hypothetical protein